MLILKLTKETKPSRAWSISFKPLKPIPVKVRLLLLGTIFILALMAIVQSRIVSRLSNISFDNIAIVLYTWGNTFGRFNKRFFKFGKAEYIVRVIMVLFYYSFITVYNSNLTAFLIGTEYVTIKY